MINMFINFIRYKVIISRKGIYFLQTINLFINYMKVDILKNSLLQLYLFHLIIVPTIIYFLLYKPSKLLFKLTIVFSVSIILYHLYKLWVNYKLDYISYVNLIHIFIIGPLLLLVGILGKNIPLVIKDFLLILLFGSIIVFLNKIIKILNIY